MHAITDTHPSPSEQGKSLVERFKASLSQRPLSWLIGTLLLVRLGFILSSPVDLIADESYYWDWSRRLDFGYYSKPPMIAWINWLSTTLLGPSEFAVRFPAALLGTFGLLWVYHLGARLFSYRVGVLSVLLLALTPGQTALSFLMTIDAPFLFCWAGALYGFWMMTSVRNPPLKWCVVTALMLGLGILSKQTMLGFFPLAGLFLLATPERRAMWLSPRVWMTAAAGLAFLAPVLIWNMRNDWITLEHTASHFSESSVTWMTQFARFAEFILGQIGVASPVLWFAIVVTMYAAFRKFKTLTPGERYLVCFSGVPMLGILVLSATRRLEPNWPAACYPAAVILVSAVLLGRSSLNNLFKSREKTLTRCWQTGLVCTAITYAAVTVVPLSPLAGSPLDITCRLRGWKTLALQFDEVVKNDAKSTGVEKPLIISTAGRDITSGLAFYLPSQPLIPLWSQDNAGVRCQYDLWPKPDTARTDAAYVITEVNPRLPESLNASFAEWESLGTISTQLGSGRQREYEIFRTRNAVAEEAGAIERTARNPASRTIR